MFQTCTRVYAILLLYFMVRFEGLYFLFQVFLNRELAVFERSSSLDQLFMIDFDILISPQDSLPLKKLGVFSTTPLNNKAEFSRSTFYIFALKFRVSNTCGAANC